MTDPTPREIADAYLDAIEGGDYAKARSYLSDRGFSYHSPVMKSENADEFIANVSHIGAILKRIDRRRVFENGDDVCHVLVFVTEFDTIRSTDVIQWMTIRNGRIGRMEAVFDGRVYRQMFLAE